MGFTAIQTADGIFLVWTDIIATTLKRSTDGVTFDTLPADVRNNSYVDRSAAFNVDYTYRLSDVAGVDHDRKIRRVKLNRYRYLTDYVGADKPELDLTLMARIQDVDENIILEPSTVTSVTRQFFSVYSNEVTVAPIDTPYAEAEEIDPLTVLTDVCVQSPAWSIDDYGYNFRDVIPAGFPAGLYKAKYTIATTDRETPISLIIPFEVKEGTK